MDNLTLFANLSELANEERLDEEIMCYGATDEELETFGRVAFILEAIVQPIIGIAGLIANILAIPILCSPRLHGMFFIMLASLAFFDAMYIILSLGEMLRRELRPESQFFVYAVRYVTYPVQNIVLSITIFMPVALAIERYKAIRHPVEYHNNHAGANLYKLAFRTYILPVLVSSVIFCIPKWLELTVNEHVTFSNITLENGTNVMSANQTFVSLGFTELRFDSNYILWYNNVTKLMGTGIIPFIALIFFNFKIYSVLQRRQAISSRLTNNPANQLKERAANQAHVFFVICAIFLICHMLRVVLGIHEFFVIEIYRQQMKVDCNEIKFSTLVAGSVSTVMLTANSSLNFVIYALMSHEFRTLLRLTLKSFLPLAISNNNNTQDFELVPMDPEQVVARDTESDSSEERRNKSSKEVEEGKFQEIAEAEP